MEFGVWSSVGILAYVCALLLLPVAAVWLIHWSFRARTSPDGFYLGWYDSNHHSAAAHARPRSCGRWTATGAVLRARPSSRCLCLVWARLLRWLGWSEETGTRNTASCQTCALGHPSTPGAGSAAQKQQHPPPSQNIRRYLQIYFFYKYI